MRAELSVLIETGLSDPRVGLVTVTHVELSRDLAHARVFISMMSDAERERKETLAGLESARGFLRRKWRLYV